MRVLLVAQVCALQAWLLLGTDTPFSIPASTRPGVPAASRIRPEGRFSNGAPQRALGFPTGVACVAALSVAGLRRGRPAGRAPRAAAPRLVATLREEVDQGVK